MASKKKHWEGTHPSSPSLDGWHVLGYVSRDWKIGKNTRRGRELRALAKEYIAESFEIEPIFLNWVRDDIGDCNLCVPTHYEIEREDIRSFTQGFLDGLGYI